MSEASTAQGSMFEALFVRALKPTGAFAEALRTAGYDLAKPQPTYPTEIWVAALELAWKHAYGALEKGPAYRALGRRFTESFLDTIAGKIVKVALPFLGPESFIKRLPRYLTLGRNDLRWEVHTQMPGQLVASLHDPFGVPADFLGGIIEKGMEILRAKATVVVTRKSPTEGQLEVRW